MQEFSYPTTIRYATDLNAILREIGKNNKSSRDRERQPHQGQRQPAEELHRHAERLPELRHRAGSGRSAKRRSTHISPRIRSGEGTPARSAEIERAERADAGDAAARHRLRLDLPQLADAGAGMRALSPLAWSAPRRTSTARPASRSATGRASPKASTRAQKTIEPQSDRAGSALLPPRVAEASRRSAHQGDRRRDRRRPAASSTFLDQLYANTKMADLDERKAMYDETTAQLQARNDAMINLVAALMPLAAREREARRRARRRDDPRPPAVPAGAARHDRRQALSRRQRHAAHHLRHRQGLRADATA